MPTVIVAVNAFRPRMEPMALPRLLLTHHLMGRPFGAPHNAVRQREVIDAAFQLLQDAPTLGTIVEAAGDYRPK